MLQRVLGQTVTSRIKIIISEKNHKLSTSEMKRIQRFEEYQQNASNYAVHDTVLEVGKAGVTGALLDGKKGPTRVAKGAGSGLWSGTKLVDAGCQAVGKTLASKGLPVVMAKGCSNAVLLVKKLGKSFLLVSDARASWLRC